MSSPAAEPLSQRRRRTHRSGASISSWLRKAAALLLLLPLLVLAVLGLRWYEAERLVLEVERTLASQSSQLHFTAWQELQRQLTHALELRPDNVAAQNLQSKLWLERRLVRTGVPAGDGDPLQEWFALEKQVANESLQALRAATQLRPADPVAWVNLALGKLQAGEADEELALVLKRILRYGFGNDLTRRNLTLMMGRYPIDFVADPALLDLALDHFYAVLAPGRNSASLHIRSLNGSGNAALWCPFLEQERLADAAQRACTRATR